MPCSRSRSVASRASLLSGIRIPAMTSAMIRLQSGIIDVMWSETNASRRGR